MLVDKSIMIMTDEVMIANSVKHLDKGRKVMNEEWKMCVTDNVV